MKAKKSTRGEYVFSQVPKADIPRSQFRRTHGYKSTMSAGTLYPVFIDEALPGDTFNVRLSLFGRLATPVAPLMDGLYCDVHFFAVPNRLVWDNWVKFMGEQENPTDSTDYLIPQVVAPPSGYAVDTPYDYAGLPPTTPNLTVSALPFRAMSLIWNQWYRDQNLQDSRTVLKDDGPDSWAEYLTHYKRNKRHDYFTSSLPFPQKGPATELPLGEYAFGTVVPGTTDKTPTFEVDGVTEALYSHQDPTWGDTATVPQHGVGALLAEGKVFEWADPNLETITDLSTATAATINFLRTAFQIQKLLERDARGGTRYQEVIKSHFRVDSPDQRMQRAEFLSGGTVPLVINPVTQTSETGTTPQGGLAAYATMAGSNLGFTKSFTEHCIIIGFLSIRGDLTYQEGVNRMWLRKTRYDFYWPAFSHLGEQEVKNQELVAVDGSILGQDGVTPENDETWGYQERWAEYKYKPSLCTGLMRSNHPQGSLDFWHLAYDFDGVRPELTGTFIQENPPVDRVVAVPSQPHFIFDMWYEQKVARPMPLYSVPGLIDHF